jgi:hypothetical protein
VPALQGADGDREGGLMAFDRSAVRGLSEARKAFKALPDHVQEAAFDASFKTGHAVMTSAKRNIRPGHGYRTGELQKAIAMSSSRKTGIVKVGLVRKPLVVTLPNGRMVRHRPSKIGHLVEFGHGGPKPARAFPFMIPAAEGERVEYASRMRRGLKEVERDMAARGGRML